MNCSPPRYAWLQTEKTGLRKFIFNTRKASWIIVLVSAETELVFTGSWRGHSWDWPGG